MMHPVQFKLKPPIKNSDFSEGNTTTKTCYHKVQFEFALKKKKKKTISS